MLYRLVAPLPFPFQSLAEYPEILCVCCKLSQKEGTRNCSLLSILKDGETLLGMLLRGLRKHHMWESIAKRGE